MNNEQKAELRNIFLKLNSLSGLILNATENTFKSLSKTSCFGGDAIFSKCFTLLEEVDAGLVEAYHKLKHVERLCQPCTASNARSMQGACEEHGEAEKEVCE